MSVVTCMAHVLAHRETGDGAALASARLAHVLAQAFETQEGIGDRRGIQAEASGSLDTGVDYVNP